MGLRQAFSAWLENTKDAFGFGGEFPELVAAQRHKSPEDSAELKRLLEEAREDCHQKDERIAQLQATPAAQDATQADMVVDGPAYYLRKGESLDGPFCTSCFQQNHEVSRIVSAAKPSQDSGVSSDWVLCTKCRTPFRSDRISHYLNAGKTQSETAPASAQAEASPPPVVAPPKPRARPRRPAKPAFEATTPVPEPQKKRATPRRSSRSRKTAETPAAKPEPASQTPAC
jgi:hypothetical protein